MKIHLIMFGPMGWWDQSLVLTCPPYHPHPLSPHHHPIHRVEKPSQYLHCLVLNKILHITRVNNPTTMLVNPIGLKIMLLILHMSNKFFDGAYFIVDIGKFITNPVMKDLLI
jgi:hypothetical protein